MFICFLILVVLLAISDAKRVVCYTTNWSQYREGLGKFVPEDIDPHLCTHLIYSFVKLNGTKLAPMEWNDDSTDLMKGMYERTMDLKLRNNQLKILLAIGGANFDNSKLVEIVKSHEKLREFSVNCVDYLKKRNFDGLDLDWEYPNGYKKEFTKLVIELKNEFKNFNLLLTAAVAASKENIDASYDIPQLALYLDFLNLMTYDYHGAWEKTTGHVAPLYSRKNENNEQKMYNVDFTIQYYINQGFPEHKINLGFACYGKSYTLKSTKFIRFGSPVQGAGIIGNYTKENGTLAFYEICERMNDNWESGWDDEHKVAFLYRRDQFVGYENEESLKEKVEYVKKKHLGGIMFWSMDMDDFSGSFCKRGKYPMIKTVRDFYMPHLNQIVKLKKNERINECYNGDGFYVNLKDQCNSYYVCEYSETSSFKIRKYSCPKGTLFDKNLIACNFKQFVKCD
ncbi:unnamed protein product [Brachionus calyciflorus]|uniref:Chitinase n=1 Tax=Brachionus calyciflorus TaxID=104777 RepID=A0A814BJS1_9BILA|nr:unnamed protein product [Brachionus calyciflorus]